MDPKCPLSLFHLPLSASAAEILPAGRASDFTISALLHNSTTPLLWKMLHFVAVDVALPNRNKTQYPCGLLRLLRLVAPPTACRGRKPPPPLPSTISTPISSWTGTVTFRQGPSLHTPKPGDSQLTKVTGAHDRKSNLNPSSIKLQSRFNQGKNKVKTPANKVNQSKTK